MYRTPAKRQEGDARSACASLVFRLSLFPILAGLAVTPASAEPMTGKQLETLIPDTAVEVTDDTGPDLVVRFLSGGAMIGLVRQLLLTFEDSGHWRVADNHLCIRWNEWDNADETCLDVDRNGDTLDTRGTGDSEFAMTFRVIERGTNPDGQMADLYSLNPSAGMVMLREPR